MVTLVFVTSDEAQHRVAAKVGQTVMEAARAANVPGIMADCGGSCSCATCHAYVDPRFLDRLAAPGEIELEMLDFTMDREPESRLTCQITVAESHEGMILRVPASQI